MKKLEINISKGQLLSCLQRHGKIDAPIRKFLKEHIDSDITDAGRMLAGVNCKKEISKKNYKITLTIEET